MGALAYEMGGYAEGDALPIKLDYPVIRFPEKVQNVKLEKQQVVKGTLAGIKGQYLIWSDGQVLNVRNHSGHHIEIAT